jgi:hypothetical protein
VFTHLLDPGGAIRGQKDNPPQGGRYPTPLWDTGEQIEDAYALQVAHGSPPCTYSLAVGMYSPKTMERLPIAAQSPDQASGNRLLLPGPQVLPP